MSAYVPNYEFDVFVSYAHVDDAPWDANHLGWVSTFVKYLQGELAQRLGRKEFLEIWFDRTDLSGNDAITPEIQARLNKSATILIFLSNGYLASTWCQQELELFVNHAGENSARIFVIELNKLDRPNSLNDLRGFPFWYQDADGHERRLAHPFPDPNDPNSPYYKQIQDVAEQLKKKLTELKNSNLDKGSPAASPPPLATVFLAGVPDSLRKQREEVRRYLEQQCVHILPENFSVSKLDQDLEACSMFIQLLDLDSFMELPRLQYDRAKLLNIKVSQWLDPSLKNSTVTDEDHQKLLRGPEVQATRLEDFKTYLLRQLQPKASQSVLIPEGDDMLVLLDARSEDMELANMVKDILTANSIQYWSVSENDAEGPPQELEELMKMCDTIILLYGKSPVTWIQRKALDVHKSKGKRERPLKMVTIYNEPVAGPKPPLNFSMKNFRIIDKPFTVFKDELPKLLKGELP